MKHPFFKPTSNIRIIAHRGLIQGDTFENTHDAFKHAIKQGADYLETDCRTTRDGEVVLFHDSDLKRLTGERLTISELTKKELSARLRDMGGLLTLDDALEEFNKQHFNVDVKTIAASPRAGEIIGKHSSRVLLTSFSKKARDLAYRQAIKTGSAPATSLSKNEVIRLIAALATRNLRQVAKILSNTDAVQIPPAQGPIKILSSSLLKAVHKYGAKGAGAEVHVWTINDPAQMLKLADFGIDGIITDRTDLATIIKQ